MSGLEELFENLAPAENVQGSWFTARWQPDLAAGEFLNIGVGFVSSDGEFSLRLLQDFDRLHCLYDSKNIEFHADLACRVVAELLYKDPTRRGQLTAGISIQDKGFAQGSDIDSIVDRLFDDVVTLGRPSIEVERKQPFRAISRENAYSILRNYLKRPLALSFKEHVRDRPYRKISDDFGDVELFLPFERRGGVASLTSAAYSNEWRAKFQLYEGFKDVETALKNQLCDHAALFVVLPGEGLPTETARALESKFDEFYAFVRRHEIRVESNTQLESLGDSIAEWCQEESA